MEIKDLQKKTPIKELVVEINTLEQTIDLPSGQKFQKAIVSDSTGQVVMKLWRDQTDGFAVGDKVKISKGWCGVYKADSDDEELEVSSGKYGTLSKVSD